MNRLRALGDSSWGWFQGPELVAPFFCGLTTVMLLGDFDVVAHHVNNLGNVVRNRFKVTEAAALFVRRSNTTAGIKPFAVLTAASRFRQSPLQFQRATVLCR